MTDRVGVPTERRSLLEWVQMRRGEAVDRLERGRKLIAGLPPGGIMDVIRAEEVEMWDELLKRLAPADDGGLTCREEIEHEIEHAMYKSGDYRAAVMGIYGILQRIPPPADAGKVYSKEDAEALCAIAVAGVNQQSGKTITSLCDRLDHISRICADGVMQHDEKLRQIADLSGGFMPIPGSPGEPPGKYTPAEAWNAALTLANNICVQDSDSLNAEDGSLEAMHALGAACQRIRGYLDMKPEHLDELLAEHTGRHALTKRP